MQYESLGHMPRAPLVYSLAMIEYASVPEMESHSTNIMEHLRDLYPDIHQFNVNSLKLEIDAATGESKAQQTIVPQWRMNNPESDFGLVFGTERLVVHTTSYRHFEGFADKLKHIAEIVSDVAKIKYTKSIGFRHIDNIQPFGDLTIEKIIKPGYLCPPQNSGLVPSRSRVEFVYQSSSHGQLFIRCYRLKDHPRVPQDIFPLASEISLDSDLMTPVRTDFVLADTDHLYSPKKLQPFNVTDIISTLDSLHQQCSLGFREMVTADAIAAWKKD